MTTPTDRERVVTARLSDVERAALLNPCKCGHTINDHGTWCWYDDEYDCQCQTTFETLLVDRVATILAARLAEAEQSAEQRERERDDLIEHYAKAATANLYAAKAAEQWLADVEAERDAYRARADVLRAKVSGEVALRGRKPGDYWAEWHRTHCAAAEGAARAEQRGREEVLAAVEALAGRWHDYGRTAPSDADQRRWWSVEATLRALVAQQRDGGGSE